ncbi:hypothetical protein [Psychrobacillus sp. L3]
MIIYETLVEDDSFKSPFLFEYAYQKLKTFVNYIKEIYYVLKILN